MHPGSVEAVIWPFTFDPGVSDLIRSSVALVTNSNLYLSSPVLLKYSYPDDLQPRICQASKNGPWAKTSNFGSYQKTQPLTIRFGSNCLFESATTHLV